MYIENFPLKFNIQDIMFETYILPFRKFSISNEYVDKWCFSLLTDI